MLQIVDYEPGAASRYGGDDLADPDISADEFQMSQMWDDALSQYSQLTPTPITPLPLSPPRPTAQQYLKHLWNPETHRFELEEPHYRVNFSNGSCCRKAIEYLGFFVGKSFPKSMSNATALAIVLPLLFGLTSGKDKTIVIQLVKAMGIPPEKFHNLLISPSTSELLAAGELPNMSSNRKQRWKKRVRRDVCLQNEIVEEADLGGSEDDDDPSEIESDEMTQVYIMIFIGLLRQNHENSPWFALTPLACLLPAIYLFYII